MTLPSSEIADLLVAAWGDLNAGRLAYAEQRCRRVLATEPESPDALHLLGVIASQCGQHDQAAMLLERAVALRPEAAFLCNLGEAYRARHDLDRAVACQQRALALEPRLAAAHNNLGLALQHRGEPNRAENCFRRALRLQPDLADAAINLGNLLAEAGRIVDATEAFEKVLGTVRARSPVAAKAHYNLANALRGQGLFDAAIDHYRRALEADPDWVDALNNLGLAQLESDQVQAAIDTFQAALARAPHHAQAHNNLGLALQALGRWGEAQTACARAVALAPKLAAAHNNLGRTEQMLGQTEAAIASFRRALELDPDYAQAHHNLGDVLKDMGRLEDSLAAFLRAVDEDADDADSTAQAFYQLQQCCDWDRLAALRPKIEQHSRAALADGRRPGETPFGALMTRSDPAGHYDIAKGWARVVTRRLAGSPQRFQFDRKRPAGARVRIGYLSCDFRDHPVAHQVTRLLGLHDRREFEVLGYVYGGHEAGPERARIEASCDRFADLSRLTDDDAAARIHADRVDILVDLTGYTKGNRIQISARRPAPVQVSYLGFLGTSGGDFFDYLITDEVCTPRVEARWFTENLVHLPDCCLVFGETERPGPGAQRAEHGLPQEGLVFCSLNANAKLEAEGFGLWLDLLRAVPGSVLWLYRGSDTAVALLRQAARAGGVDPERLVFADRVPYGANLARLTLADLGLDPLVYSGGLTTANMLWAGVPVVTRRGADFVSRMAASMLLSLDLPDLVADDLDGYRRVALELARSPERLQAVKATLGQRLETGPLFDTELFARRLEHGYRAMWARWLAEQPPVPITVSRSPD